jgi:aminopeptidase N
MKHLIAACLGLAGLFPAIAAPLPRPYAIDHYSARLQPDLPAKRLSAEVRIDFHSTIDSDFAALELDAGALQIKSVSEGQASQYFERHGELLVVVLTESLHPTEHRTITVQYQAGPAKGLQFFPDQIYTSAHTSDWMVCNDRPDNPATLHLEIAAPPGGQSGRQRA